MKRSDSTRQRGYQNEQLAAFYLLAKGYHIVESNWQSSHYELDLVAFEPEQKTWLFVEVKSARTIDNALRHFTPAKVKTLCHAMGDYIEGNEINCFNCQLDLIAISTDQAGTLTNIDHLTDVL